MNQAEADGVNLPRQPEGQLKVPIHMTHPSVKYHYRRHGG